MSPLILNEYNAVSPGNYLDNSNSDTYWGRVLGNGGDWFELVVTQDHVDVRGWELELSDEEFAQYARFAHDQDITFNRVVENALRDFMLQHNREQQCASE